MARSRRLSKAAPSGAQQHSQTREGGFEHGHVRRRRRFEPQRLAGHRMAERQHGRVERLTVQPCGLDRGLHGRRRGPCPIGGIAQARRALVRQMDPDLMSAAGLQRAANPRRQQT